MRKIISTLLFPLLLFSLLISCSTKQASYSGPIPEITMEIPTAAIVNDAEKPSVEQVRTDFLNAFHAYCQEESNGLFTPVFESFIFTLEGSHSTEGKDVRYWGCLSANVLMADSHQNDVLNLEIDVDFEYARANDAWRLQNWVFVYTHSIPTSVLDQWHSIPLYAEEKYDYLKEDAQVGFQIDSDEAFTWLIPGSLNIAEYQFLTVSPSNVVTGKSTNDGYSYCFTSDTFGSAYFVREYIHDGSCVWRLCIEMLGSEGLYVFAQEN